MISRIRLDLYGTTPSEVEANLRQFVAFVSPRTTGTFNSTGTHVSPLYSAPMVGEFVIERDTNEPEDSVFAYKGRALLYPSITTDGERPAMPEPIAA